MSSIGLCTTEGCQEEVETRTIGAATAPGSVVGTLAAEETCSVGHVAMRAISIEEATGLLSRSFEGDDDDS